MNKRIIIHGGWALVAAIAFALGFFVFPAEEEKKRKVRILRSSSGGAGSEAGGFAGSVDGRGSGGVASDSGAGKGAAAEFVIERLLLSEEEILELGKQFRESSSPIDKRLAFSKLLKGLTAENALGIRAQIAHVDHRSSEFREFHYAWGVVGGVEAIMFGADTKEDDMSPALAGWASANPQEAMVWYNGLDMENDARFDPVLKDRKIPVESLRHGLLRGLVQGLADADPHAAGQFVQDMVASGQKGAEGYMQMVTHEILRTSESPAEAALWAQGLPEGRMRSEALGRVADEFAEKDPEGAAEWAANFVGQPGSERVFYEVGGNLAARDPEAALTWVNNLPEGDSQFTGMRGTVREWARKEPTAAGEYIQALPASPMRDAAIAGYSSRVAWENPQAAMEWAQSIDSLEQRHEVVIEVARAWQRRKVPGLSEWVGGAGLPPDVQQAILAPQQDRRRD